MGVFSRKQDQSEPVFKDGRRTPRRKLAPEREDGDDPLDPATSQKRRARRRLLGAAALAVGAVVILPMVFDREPNTGGQDISVQIPDQDSAFKPGSASATIPAPVAPPSAPGPATSPADSVSTLVPGANSLSTGGVAAPAAPAAAAAVPAPAVKPVEKATEKAAEKPVPKADHAETKPATPSVTAHDDPRALAALEGKPVAPISSSSAAPASGSFALQIGAFSSDAKVKELKDKLSADGLKAYTEPLNTPQGPRTRVRVGPYPSRDAADRARAKVKTLGLDSTVVPL